MSVTIKTPYISKKNHISLFATQKQWQKEPLKTREVKCWQLTLNRVVIMYDTCCLFSIPGYTYLASLELHQQYQKHLYDVSAIPLANPISDSCKVGASFVPSPVTATTSYRPLKCSTSFHLSVGDDLAITYKL